MSETVGLYFLAGGAALMLLAQLWLVIAAFRQHLGWGFAVLLLPPVGLIFLLLHFRRAAIPVLVFLVGLAVGATPYVVNHFYSPEVHLSEHERVVEGEPTLTVTGLQNYNYASLADKPYLEVLQMANPDVTDQTLVYLRGMTKLRELDLNNTQVGDEGLKVLAGLPKLAILRLKGTHITYEGFRQTLADKESLLELDLRATKVTAATRQAWLDARKRERKVLPRF